ncbi:MAG: hypothetical protein JSW52_02105 [Candidatus Coatesbacteria bacterium]|nr:MAG: hypothetical protein JSW52_02105 [Candidatus Coatesbacteria bacterium]
MFRLEVDKDTASFKEEALPRFLETIEEEILGRWREDGYRTGSGEVELDSEKADTAYYFDVRKGSIHFRLVIGVKETDGVVTVTSNVAYYPKDTKYLLLASAVAGAVTGTFFYYYGIAPYVFTPLGITTAWFLSVTVAAAANFFIIRYFHSSVKKYLRPGGGAKFEALVLEREVRELAGETLFKYGDFAAG